MIIKRFQVDLEPEYKIIKKYSYLSSDIDSLNGQLSAKDTKKVWGSIKRKYELSIKEVLGISKEVELGSTAFLLAVDRRDNLIDGTNALIALPCPPFCNKKESSFTEEI